jgi:hypothetical protein
MLANLNPEVVYLSNLHDRVVPRPHEYSLGILYAKTNDLKLCRTLGVK